MTKDKVKIIEVGPRDGLQNEAVFVPTEAKIKFINLLSSAGFEEIETTSFVNPNAIPQLADAEDVLNGIERNEKTIFSCLVPNLRGLERAFPLPFQKAVFFVGASETFNKKNVNMSVAQSFKLFREMAKVCKERGWGMRGSISTAFVCPYEGEVKWESVAKVIDQFLSLEIYEISLCDTIGVVSPKEVEGLLLHLEKRYPLKLFSLHLHDTMGCALASLYKGYEIGIRTFETSVGGLGGCPYAPGASGNLASEVAVYLFERLGVDTGIDLNRLVKAGFFIEERLGKLLPSPILNYYRCLGKR